MKLNLIKAIYYFEGAQRIAGVSLLANSLTPYLVDKDIQKDIDAAQEDNSETDKLLERFLE